MYFLQNATNQISNALSPLQDIAKALHDSDRTNIVLAGATIVLALATIIFGILDRGRTQRQVRRSEQRSDDEQFERMRPWITIKEAMPLQVVFQNNQAMGWERYLEIAKSSPLPERIKFGMQIVNTGLRPARNLKKIDLGQDAPVTRNELEAREEKDINVDLGVNQSYYDFFEIPWKMFDMSFETPIYFALRISYDNGRTRSFSGAIYMVIRHQSNVVTVWYT